MDNKKSFALIPVQYIDQINPKQINEDINNLRLVHFDNKAVVSWNGLMPQSIQNIEKFEGPFTEEIIENIIENQNTVFENSTRWNFNKNYLEIYNGEEWVKVESI